MPRASKPKTRVHAGSQSVIAEVGIVSSIKAVEQRKQQAQEPIYLNRM